MKFSLLSAGLIALFSGLISLAHAEHHTDNKEMICKHTGMFDMMDANHDGNVDKTEFDVFHNNHFTKMDKNSDKNISKDEMKVFHDEKHAAHKDKKSRPVKESSPADATKY